VGMKPGKEVDAANNLRSRVWPGVGWVNLSPLEDMDPGLPCAGGGRRGTARHGCCGLRRKPMENAWGEKCREQAAILSAN
jgi:hypothetical protein